MKSVGLKKRPKKNLCISVKSVGQNFHRISRMNQRHSCLSDYSRICADIWPLANGSRPIHAHVVFGHADFADDADFSSREGFVPQIYTDFTDFLNLRRIALSDLRGYLFFVGLFFVPQISQIYTDFFESQANRFVRSQGVSATTEQVVSAKFRVIR